MLSTQRSVMAATALMLPPAQCGVSTTFGRSRSRDPAGQGLDLEHVEPGARDPTLGQRLDERALVDEAAARGVDQEGGRLHQRQTLAVDELVGLGAVRRMDRDEIRLAEHIFELDQLDPFRRGIGRIGDRIVGQHAHLEAPAAPRERPADPAEPDDSDGRAPESRVEVPAPAALHDLLMIGEQTIAERCHEGQRHVGDRLVIGAESHRDGDTMAGRSSDVDRVVADSHARHDLAAGRRGEHPPPVAFAARDAGEAARQHGRQLVLGQRPAVGVDQELAARRLQALQACPRRLVNARDRHQNPGHRALLSRARGSGGGRCG